MSHKRLWVAATIIALVILIGFVLSVPHTKDVGNIAAGEDTISTAPPVSLRDSYKKGVHTISGSLQAPNACMSVTAQASLVSDASSTESILVALSMPEDSGVCLQVPTKINFSTTISAPAHLPITATVNGIPATTTVS